MKSRTRALGARARARAVAYVELLRAALEAHPTDPTLRQDLGRALAAQREERTRPLREAVSAGERATGDLEARLSSGEPVGHTLARALSDLARSHLSIGDLEAAVCAVSRALVLSPPDREALSTLAEILFRQERFAAARAVLDRLVRLFPGEPGTMGRLAACLVELLHIEDALSWSMRALAIDPACVTALVSASAVHLIRSELDLASGFIERAFQAAPGDQEVRFLRAELDLTRGDFESGWTGWEARYTPGDDELREPGYPSPRWDGSELAGRTILITPEMGHGDILQFVRFLPALKSRGGHVVLACYSELVNLLRRCEGVDSIVPARYPQPLAFDCHLPIGSLPLALGLSLTGLPYRSRYVQAEPGLAACWKQRLAREPGIRRFKVGLVWAGNPGMRSDFNRSLASSALAPLGSVPHVTFISLQLPATPRRPESALGLFDWTDELIEFEDTAGLIANLDLVIAVDTAVAHLAGAMGIPVWTLVRCDADYRWMRHREDSPWYPTMRLFRQDRPLVWGPAVERVTDALHAFVRERLNRKDPG